MARIGWSRERGTVGSDDDDDDDDDDDEDAGQTDHITFEVFYSLFGDFIQIVKTVTINLLTTANVNKII